VDIRTSARMPLMHVGMRISVRLTARSVGCVRCFANDVQGMQNKDGSVDGAE